MRLTTDVVPLTMATMTKALAYLRVSGKGQIQGDKAYALAQDVRIVPVVLILKAGIPGMDSNHQ